MPFAGPDRRQKVLVLLTMCFALFMAMLDNTVVNVALPTISRELGAGVSGLQWMVDGYVLAFASLLLTGGILGDRYGRRRLFLTGLPVFTLASLACGLSQSTGQLVGFRIIQGVGAALLMPGTLSIITTTFPVHERAQAIGIWAGVSGLALSLGPTAGGWVVEHLGWESVFFLNVPIGTIGFVVASRVVRESRAAKARHVDLPGLVLGTAGLTTITFALIEANERGWSDGLIRGALVAGASLLLAFVMWERRAPEPMMPLNLFRIPAFATGMVVALAISFAMFGTFFFFTLYFQIIRGSSALETGVRFLPLTGMILIGAPLSGRLAGRYGSRWPLTAGMTLAGTGLVLLSRASPTTPYTRLAPVLVMMGLGMSFTMTPMTAAVMNAVGQARAGLGGAMTNTGREVGGVLGVALLGTILTTTLRHSLASALAGGGLGLAPPLRDAIVEAGGHGRLPPSLVRALTPEQAGFVQQAFRDAFMDGFGRALLIAGVALLVVATVANVFIGRGTPAEDIDVAAAPSATMAT